MVCSLENTGSVCSVPLCGCKNSVVLHKISFWGFFFQKKKKTPAPGEQALTSNEQTDGEEETKKPKVLTDIDIITRLDKKMIAVVRNY